jgi:hypothetical protein
LRHRLDASVNAGEGRGRVAIVRDGDANKLLEVLVARVDRALTVLLLEMNEVHLGHDAVLESGRKREGWNGHVCAREDGCRVASRDRRGRSVRRLGNGRLTASRLRCFQGEQLLLDLLCDALFDCALQLVIHCNVLWLGLVDLGTENRGAAVDLSPVDKTGSKSHPVA